MALPTHGQPLNREWAEYLIRSESPWNDGEGNWNPPTEQMTKIANYGRQLMALFDRYGANSTLELPAEVRAQMPNGGIYVSNSPKTLGSAIHEFATHPAVLTAAGGVAGVVLAPAAAAGASSGAGAGSTTAAWEGLGGLAAGGTEAGVGLGTAAGTGGVTVGSAPAVAAPEVAGYATGADPFVNAAGSAMLPAAGTMPTATPAATAGGAGTGMVGGELAVAPEVAGAATTATGTGVTASQVGAGSAATGTLMDALSSPNALPVAGAIAGALGSDGPDSSTTTTAPWAPAQPYIQANLEAASQYANQPLPYANAAEMVAPLNAQQQQAATTGMASATGAQGVVNSAQAGIQPFLSGDYMKVESNPYLQAAIAAANRPLTQSYQETVLPGIRGNYAGGDAYDNSRQGIAEGIAARSYLDAVGTQSATMANRGYETGLQATQQAFSQVPGLTTASAAPAQNMFAIGNALQAQDQAERDAKAKFDAMQAQKLANVSNIFNAAGRGGQVSTTPLPQTNPWLAAIGGAVTASQIPGILKQGGVTG